MPNWIEKHGDTLITIAAVIGSFAALVAILGQQLDAQDKLIAQRFGAVDQRFDAVYQRFDAVYQRFDAVDRRFDSIDQRFDAVDQRFDAMDKRIDRLADEVSELRKLTVSISERVSKNEGRIDVILDQMRAADTPSP